MALFHSHKASLVAINVAWVAQRSQGDVLGFRRPTTVAALLLATERARRAGVAAHGFTEVT